jgi:hypothetical protein
MAALVPQREAWGTLSRSVASSKRGVATDGGHEEVGATIRIEVPRRHAHAVPRTLEAAALGGLAELTTAVVGPQSHAVVARLGLTGEGLTMPTAAIDEDQILIAIAIDVEEADTATHRLRQQGFTGGTRGVDELDARCLGHIGEGHRGQRLLDHARKRRRDRRRIGHALRRRLAKEQPEAGTDHAKRDDGRQRSTRRTRDAAVVMLWIRYLVVHRHRSLRAGRFADHSLEPDPCTERTAASEAWAPKPVSPRTAAGIDDPVDAWGLVGAGAAIDASKRPGRCRSKITIGSAAWLAAG